MNYWQRVTKYDARAVALADRHYSRRKIGSPQFMPPGQTIVLLSLDECAVYGWWRPAPSSGLKAMNGLDGWTCTIFRNERAFDGEVRSSALILDAEAAIRDYGYDCGPDGLITYVWDAKVRPTERPGWCFRKAGYRETGRSADGKKTLLQKAGPQ